MALPTAIQGAQRPSPLITWYQQDSETPLDLTGATITALISDGTTVATSDGTFTVTDAANGVFRWDLGDTDVATAGLYTVQFNADFGSEPTPARTFKARWRIEPALVATP